MFLWLFLNEGTQMRCQYCTDAGKANIFMGMQQVQERRIEEARSYSGPQSCLGSVK